MSAQIMMRSTLGKCGDILRRCSQTFPCVYLQFSFRTNRLAKTRARRPLDFTSRMWIMRLKPGNNRDTRGTSKIELR